MAGLRLGLVDADGQVVAGMRDDAVRDGAGRRFPAHLDVRYGDVDWWHGDQRYDREQPWYTFDRSRHLRDRWRRATGTPGDHQQPQPGDAPRERTRARVAAARARAAEARERATERARAQRVERARLGLPEPPDPLEFDCTCPAGCDPLLLADLPAGDPWHRPHLHVDDCPCGCDIS
ncbi:hypothetical protein [Modestobacter sp. NPDC049651]|uniref:hypothetical protein n=2 Tax=unclassified Modestobacter TaxID=2643866 RepID=UPI0033DD11A7